MIHMDINTYGQLETEKIKILRRSAGHPFNPSTDAYPKSSIGGCGDGLLVLDPILNNN